MSHKVVGGLRERKKDDTRRAIAAAALELALEHGPGQITVEDIAREANVAPRTVYNYFETKEDAILGVDAGRRHSLIEDVLSRPAGETPLKALRETLGRLQPDEARNWRVRAHLAGEHPQLLAAYLTGLVNLEQELAAAIDHRQPTADIAGPPARLWVAVALAAMRVSVEEAVSAGTDIEAAVEQAFNALIPADEATG